MGIKVFLNVYDLSPANDCLYPAGFGVHHSGVEVLGSEYAFGSGGGIFDSTPKEAAQAKFRESILLGTIEGGSSQLKSVISQLRNEFKSDNYNILTRNCNHFANALVFALLGRQIPPHINRVAYIGSIFSCLIPKKMLESAPVEGTGEGQNSSSGFQSFSGSGRGTSFQNNAKVGVGSNTMSRFQSSSGKKLGTNSNDGSNSRLGGGLQALLGTMSVGGTSDRGKDDLTDRRERVRKAALARLEQQGNGARDT